MPEILHTIKAFVESFPPGVFPLLAAAMGLSAIQVKLHKKLSVENPKVKVLISTLLSVLIVLLPHWIGLLQGNKDLLGAYTAEVLSAMSLFYNLVLKEVPALNADLSPNAVTVTVPETLPEPTVQPAQEETASEFGPQV